LSRQRFVCYRGATDTSIRPIFAVGRHRPCGPGTAPGKLGPVATPRAPRVAPWVVKPLNRSAARSVATDNQLLISTLSPAHRAPILALAKRIAEQGLVASEYPLGAQPCDRHSRLLDRDGWPVPGLYVAGPLARGTFGELMGLPQVSEHAAAVAEEVAAALDRDAAAEDAA